MTTCESYRNLILLAASHELNTLERNRLGLHLAACSDCRAFEKDANWLAAHAAKARPEKPPRLDIPQLESRSRRLRRRVLQLRLSVALSAAAALMLVVTGPRLWVSPLSGTSPQPELQHLALLDEWQFWLVSWVAQQGHETTPLVFQEGWNEQDFARHLLVLEGLVPEETAIVEENGREATPGALPPITLQGYSIPALLRS